MLNKKRSLLRHKLLFLVTIPISGLLLTSFVVLKNDGTKAVPLPSNRLSHTKGQLNNKKTIGEIFWEGNFLFTSAELSRFLGMNKGDKYKKENLHNRVWEDMDGIATFYFDRGYMFFNAEFIEMPVNNDIMDLRIIITEGMPVKVRNIIINGNKKVRDEDIRAKIQLLPDELFSKTKIIQSLEAIKEMEAFDDNIEVTPIPITDEAISTYSITDVVFELTEK